MEAHRDTKDLEKQKTKNSNLEGFLGEVSPSLRCEVKSAGGGGHGGEEVTGWVWWCLLIISAPGRLRQEDHHEFKARLDYIVNFRSSWSLE